MMPGINRYLAHGLKSFIIQRAMISQNRMPSPSPNPIGVIVTSGISANSLGIIRSFGRRGIPVVYLDSDPDSIARPSRYVNKRLTCRKIKDSESDFVNLLIDFGKQQNGRMMIIPTGDEAVLALSKHRDELEPFCHLPVPEYETAQKLVNKERFYRMLDEMQIPYPKTYFPESPTELVALGNKLAYPYIIKPAYSIPFQEEFGRKVFHVKSPQDLDRAAARLRNKNMAVMIQEIIPGREIYAFFTYFNKSSEPLAICGWDKIRQYPLDFGCGTFCKSNWRPAAADNSFRLLRTIGYQGFAEVEVKMDPRDGEYKMIEINARTSLQNTLSGACGADIAYVAYLDAGGQVEKPSLSFRNSILWAEDFLDTVSFLKHLGRRDISTGEIVDSLNPRKVRSVSAWDDPVPLFSWVVTLSSRALRRLFRR
jgi:predicted ATP-grasp superfamily ATP-dependent carboligase